MKSCDYVADAFDAHDTLDGFRCKVDAKNPAKLDADLRLLLDERKFPYDYAATGIGCGL